MSALCNTSHSEFQRRDFSLHDVTDLNTVRNGTRLKSDVTEQWSAFKSIEGGEVRPKLNLRRGVGVLWE